MKTPVSKKGSSRKSIASSSRNQKEQEEDSDFDTDLDQSELPTPTPKKSTSKRKEKKSEEKAKQEHESMEESDVKMEDEIGSKITEKKKRKYSVEQTVVMAKPDADQNEQKTNTSRSKERKELLALVPKMDADGISYTKLQLRRMAKRLKKGLSPIPTAHEEQERLKQERQMQREDELEFSDMLYSKSEVTGRNDEEGDDDDEGDDDEGDDEEGDDEEGETRKEFTAPEEPFVPSKKNPQPPSKKTKRSKPVPPDYTCMACNTKSDHWIYDCPNKITKRGTNLVAKKLRGIHHPDAKKVFVSGLPFEMKNQDVEGLFKGCGSIAQCKLVTFPDTGRCKGQAFISFDTDEGAKQALKLSGQELQNEPAQKPKKGKKQMPEPSKKTLKLKVTKVLNRIQTKGSGGN